MKCSPLQCYLISRIQIFLEKDRKKSRTTVGGNKCADFDLLLITTHQRVCRKEMFSVVSVCNSDHGGGPM